MSWPPSRPLAARSRWNLRCAPTISSRVWPRALTACCGCVAVQTASGVILREVESGSPQSGNKSLVAGMHLISMKEGVSEATQLGDMSLPEVEALLAAWGRDKAAEPLTLNFQT